VASHHTDRQRPEWPPHPDRVFQALVAAWGESGKDTNQRVALEWLCALPPPNIVVPADVRECAAPTVYVPVNDTEGPKRGAYTDKHLGLMPERRARKERFFPASHVGDGVCSLIWSDTDPGEHRAALSALCAAATRIGHSSSLVRMWIEDTPPEPTYIPAPADIRRHSLKLRVPGAGRMNQLIEAFADGNDAWRRPPTASWQGYVKPSTETKMPHSLFDPRLIILHGIIGEHRFGLSGSQVTTITDALRKTLIASAETTGSSAAKTILSGHAANGAPSEIPHAAYFPLAHVGSEYADGHLLGVAIALPRNLSRADEDACFLALSTALHPHENSLRLKMGTSGVLALAYGDQMEELRQLTLRQDTWCHPSDRWATVTPVVLDRFPPRRHEDMDNEAAACIATACIRIGLPSPSEVRILTVSRLAGAPAAKDYAPLIRKTDSARRWHVHAELLFPEPVEGPVLIGAGRFRGYGLCKPYHEGVSGGRRI
jgi:CRISPR-associated protein Csb2